MARSNEFLARRTYQVGLLARTVRTKPILLFTPGKTGSTSVRDGLRAATGRPVIHLHRVTSMGIDAARRVRHEHGASGRSAPDWRGEVARLLLRTDPRGCDIVTIIREPVARAISAFFQTGPRFGYLEGIELTDRPSDQVIDEVTQRFLNSHVHPASIHWTRWELERAVGIELLGRGEPRRGTEVYECDGNRGILIRYEDLGPRVSESLADFVGVPEISIPRRNISTDKASGGLHAELRKRMVLPDWYIDAVYSAPSTRQFYSDDEIAGFRAKWTSNRDRSQVEAS